MRGRILTFVKDSLFPYFCTECGREREWWCGDCRPRNNKPQIIRAGNELESVSALFHYRENRPLEKLIHDFKYNFVRDLESLWKEIIKEAHLSLGSAVVIPVPLHKRRERERGYNQSEIIAEILSLELGSVLSYDLVRVRSTLQQAKLGIMERLENVQDAFAWVGEEAPEAVILVDDVYTTGATMNECAKILKKAGTKKVTGFVLAHG